MAGCWLQPTALSAIVAYRSCPMDQELVSTSRAQRRWGKGVALAIDLLLESYRPLARLGDQIESVTRPRLARKYEQSKKGPLDSREATPARRRLAGAT